jgi:hypothetical protein
MKTLKVEAVYPMASGAFEVSAADPPCSIRDDLQPQAVAFGFELYLV